MALASNEGLGGGKMEAEEREPKGHSLVWSETTRLAGGPRIGWMFQF